MSRSTVAGILGEAEPRVLDAERVGHALAVLVVVARAVERHRAVGAGGLARLEHALGVMPISVAISAGVGARPSSRGPSSP